VSRACPPFPDEQAEGGRRAHALHPELYTKAFYRAAGLKSAAKRGCPKLPDAVARVIADLRKQGLSVKTLAKSYRVSGSAILRAIERVS
jgi:lambda repressor-like predicted transcriptional regulator